MIAFIRRHRRLFAVLWFAFVVFELTRLVALGDYLLPYWQAQAAAFAELTTGPWWMDVPVLTVTACAFIVPMILVVSGLRFAHRKLSQKGTTR